MIGIVLIEYKKVNSNKSSPIWQKIYIIHTRVKFNFVCLVHNYKIENERGAINHVAISWKLICTKIQNGYE
jgi:hypothetical protein